MRYFDNYAYFYELQRDIDAGFKKLKSKKPQYLDHVKKNLENNWNQLPKREYLSRYHSRNNPSLIITLKCEHIFFILCLERSQNLIEGGMIVVYETHIVFLKDSFKKLVMRTDTKDGRATMSFRMHDITQERMLRILKKDTIFRQFIERINEVA
ncbi:MAG: hypothetical protein U9P44_01730 [archaeon]|nr:hypothetical protein [archaeon]